MKEIKATKVGELNFLLWAQGLGKSIQIENPSKAFWNLDWIKAGSF